MLGLRMWTVVLALITIGCDPGPRDERDFSQGPYPAYDHATGSTGEAMPWPGDTGGDDTGESSGGSDDGAWTRFDLGVPPRVPVDCRNIDFLFVIDDSTSMRDEQQNLVRSVPGFVEGIELALQSTHDYHVGVVTTDAYAHNEPTCTELGALVTRTGGEASSDSQCGPFAEGHNYMTRADDLAHTFDCAARVGIDGLAHERPMQALEFAVSATMGESGGCNDGFLRDDALLVVVILTDEADGPGDPGNFVSPGTPESWYESVVAAKGGDPNQVVVVSFVGEVGGPCEIIPGSGYDGRNIVAFTELFEDNGFVAPICADDYGPAFAEAIEGIARTCAPQFPTG